MTNTLTSPGGGGETAAENKDGKKMGMYQIIVSRGKFVNTVVEWHTCLEEVVERAKEYLDWLGCTEWKVRKVA